METKTRMATDRKRGLTTTRNWKLVKSDTETIKGVSCTVPSETYTIREIVERFATQMPTAVQHKMGTWDPNASLDSEDLEKIPHMDLHERELMAQANQRDIAEKQKLVKQDEETKKSAKQKEAEKQEKLNKLLEEQEKPKTDGGAEESGFRKK